MHRAWLPVMGTAVALLVVGSTIALATLFSQAKTIDLRYVRAHQMTTEETNPDRWLPSFVLPSASEIVQRHDLDLDAVQGAFVVDPRDLISLAEELPPLEGECVLSLPRKAIKELQFLGTRMTCGQLRALGFAVFRVAPSLGGAETDKWGYIVLINESKGTVLYWSDAFR